MKPAYFKDLHHDDLSLWLTVEKSAWRLADGLNLVLNEVRPVRKARSIHFSGRAHGRPDFIVEICLRNFVKGRWLKDRVSLHEIYDTVCHEIAHLQAGVGNSHNHHFYKSLGEVFLLAEKMKIFLDFGLGDDYSL